MDTTKTTITKTTITITKEQLILWQQVLESVNPPKVTYDLEDNLMLHDAYGRSQAGIRAVLDAINSTLMGVS